MRITRLVTTLLAVLLAAVLFSPTAAGGPPLRVDTQITDQAGVLSAGDRAAVAASLDRLFDKTGIKLWVVYVDDFGGQGWMSWAQQTERLSDFGNDDALLAIAVKDRAFAFNVDPSVTGGSSTLTDQVRRSRIEPALRKDDWAGAAIGAADGLAAGKSSAAGGTGPSVSSTSVWVVIGIGILLVALLWLWSTIRSRRRRRDELAAAKRVDPTDPNALAGLSLDALDGLSRIIVVDVDNAVRTSEHELELATEEFGTERTEPFRAAVEKAKTALAQAFTVRQTLDDRVPETPLQRRDLLTRVIVAAGRADRELEAQTASFEDLRNLLINAPERLDGLTRDAVALRTRMESSALTLDHLHRQYAESALSSVAGNVTEARDRVAFGESNIAAGRELLNRPAGDQMGLVDAIHAAENALGQATILLDAVDTASSDINRAIAGLPAGIADIQRGIDAAAVQLNQSGTPHAAELAGARDGAVAAVADASAHGDTDPLGVFARLTVADAALDQVLERVDQERREAEQQARILEQALFTASSRVKAVSDFVDTRRGSIGPEARTRLAEATRQLEAAQAKKSANPGEAIAHANGASSLAAQAQALANEDVRASQQHFYRGGGPGSGGADLGSVLGGIIIGNVLRGGGGWGDPGGSWGGGRSAGRPSSWGGASRSSGRNYSGGRF